MTSLEDYLASCSVSPEAIKFLLACIRFNPNEGMYFIHVSASDLIWSSTPLQNELLDMFKGFSYKKLELEDFVSKPFACPLVENGDSWSMEVLFTARD